MLSIQLRTWVGRPVMALLSLKPDQQAKRITKFLQGPATVLLWPSDVALSNEALLTLISKSSIQAIHIGGVSELNKDVTFTQVSIITTVAETSSADAEQKTTLEQYPIGSLNDACNEQGAASVLEPHRQVVRTSLAKAWPARALYKAFMVYHREHHPQWSAVYLVKQANQYAQEFLLRGEPGSKEGLIGGRVALASKYLDSWNLRAAVQSGYLLLAS
ncbi:hypothetical protein FRC12_014897 [Ceratobasidium sp. 428]|nr:hypothetical protein FRC12_014897 [Ceratobasidium sp. 428]